MANYQLTYLDPHLCKKPRLIFKDRSEDKDLYYEFMKLNMATSCLVLINQIDLLCQPLTAPFPLVEWLADMHARLIAEKAAV